MKTGAPTKVILLDGTVTDTWSNEWREECLKRNEHVQAVFGMLGRSNRDRRERYYESIRRHEGAESESRVRAAVERLWKADQKRIKLRPTDMEEIKS